MYLNRKFSGLIAGVMTVLCLAQPFTAIAETTDSYDMNVTVNLSGEKKEISPYIYGINEPGDSKLLAELNINAVRQGGNRLTAYNWETNASNAGSDWYHSSDTFMSDSTEPAAVAQKLSETCEKYDVPYKFTTLQLAGYVSADTNGNVSEDEAAPSNRWNEVVFTKGSALSDTPDLTDGVVYMDEYVNYILNKLGDSTTSTGIQGYSLDNEPVLWSHTHSRIHPEPVTVSELSEKSIEVAKMVKSLDPDAEIFGPALYGYTAYDHLAGTDDWETIKASENYHWYLDCYLDDMKKASDESGVRLLDVLDIHYYTESGRNGAEDRLQSVRTLYEKGFAENSWIGEWCQENIPILPTIQNSIDTYFPGTKLAISEYNFGGEDLSATIAQAEALGCYADAGVYLATLWGGNSYIYSGIKLYTNYDGNNSTFGDTLVPTITDDVSLASSYSAINGNDDSIVTTMLTNKSFTEEQNVVITLNNSSSEYEAAAVYAVYGDSADIRLIDIIDNVENNIVNVNLPAYSAAMVVITDDATDFENLEIYNPDKYTQKTETFEDLSEMINENGFTEIPITDPEHLVRIDITANVTSSAGSSWGSAGCAVCINAVDSEGNGFWTSKGYSLSLGNDSTASVEFDGTLSNDGVIVDAVVADGKVELQKWWDSSEKMEADVEDIISVEYTQVKVIYEYETEITTTTSNTDTTSSVTMYGDANCDGEVNISDVVAVSAFVSNATKNKLSEQGIINADVKGNGDGPSADDAFAIQQFATSIIDKLPV